MALPSRSNARIGLPSHPAPRSRSLSARAPREDVPPRPASSASDGGPRGRSGPLPPLPNTLRSQRSFHDLRSRAPSSNSYVPPPPLPALRPLRALSEGGGALELRRSDESIVSMPSAASSQSSVSSSSSLFSFPASSSSASSTSSYEDVGDTAKDESREVSHPADGFGLSLWTRVAAAAGNLTVSVGRAIETNIVSYVGEVTPPGQDSRLTRAMKDYHISKARESSDLPEWLFEERDRGALGQLRIANVTSEDEARKPMISRPPAPSFVSRPPTPVGRRSGIMVTSDSDSSRSRTLSLDRKRSARVRFADQVHPRLEAMAETMSRVPPRPTMSSTTGNFAMVRSTAVPPIPRRNVVKLADVNVHGRRPSAQGLPSGVRPQRQRITAQ